LGGGSGGFSVRKESEHAGVMKMLNFQANALLWVVVT
jgi:hypothetical protein